MTKSSVNKNDGTPAGSPGKIRNIADLARLAGVTPGTVSRALADKPMVSLRTREKIQELARQHGFRVNIMARNLRTQRTGVIGVVIPMGHDRRQHISDPFFMSILAQLADLLTEAGYDLMLSRVIPDADDWLERITGSGMLDGVMLIGQSNQFETIERVAREYRPLVVWGAHEEGQVHCSVGTDNIEGGQLAGTHLIERGARRLAFLGDVSAPEPAMRYEGFCRAAAAADLPKPICLKTHFSLQLAEADIAAHLTGDLDGIDGILAASDSIAFAVLRALTDRNIAVPNQVRVIGYDDLPLATQTVPRLTSVKQDLAQGARAMTDALFRRLKGEDTPSVIMPPLLAVRDSS